MLRSKNPLDSFAHALNGVLLAFRTQKHLRVHFLVAILVMIAAFICRLTRVEVCLLGLAIALVFITELINTTVESVVDLVTTDYHPLARAAKDIAAGSVLVAAGAAGLCGVLLFLDLEQLEHRLTYPAPRGDPVQVSAIGLVLLLVVLIVWKARGGQGTFLHGGVVSGHSAIACFLCTVILLLSQHPFVAFLAVLLAVLVCQSRVESGVHTLREVLFGALLGVGLPVLLYRLIPAVTGLLFRQSG